MATDYCSSIHATSLLHTRGLAAPWFRLTPAEVIVGATLNAAYSLGSRPCGLARLGKRGDLVIFDAPTRRAVPRGRRPRPRHVVIGGRIVHGARV